MSSLSAVLPHLERRFDSQRLVFWHDADGEYAGELDALGLSGVTTVRVENNEYTEALLCLRALATGYSILSWPTESSLLTEPRL